MFASLINIRPHGETRIGRRALLSGGAAIAVTTMIPVGTSVASTHIPLVLCRHKELQPAFFGGFVADFAAGLASGWLLDVLRNYGLIPGTRGDVASSVAEDHSRAVSSAEDQGFDVRQPYSGDYASGQIAVSDAQRGDDYLALATAEHPWNAGTRRCSLVHYAPDLFALSKLGSALKNKGVPTQVMQSAGFPIHQDAQFRDYDGYGHRAWREAMTSNGGQVRWRSRLTDGGLSTQAEVDSPHLKANVEYTA